MPILVSNLTKRYKNQIANNSISLEIHNNEIIGLLGANGAGKSTLMKSIAGILDYDEGTITIDGLSLKENPLEYKQKIGFLAENNPLYNEMFIVEYLEFVANIMNTHHSEIKNVIEAVGLQNEIHKKIHQLSKGYKQRVGLAQAIIHKPKYLILDEPTSGLDPNQIIEIRNLIQQLANETTIILSTHIMQEVEAICQRVILINKGSIIQDTTVQNFKDKFKSLEEAFHHYTQETETT
ncbi:MAG: ATP-binding cassette domain-containing protein [Flavobacteriales bacterium]|nr:ATP-binding cassette domain-containing protein [Flavobacteriales bacterium]